MSHSPSTSDVDFPACHVERRADGSIIVRVPSTGSYGETLPDAVFAFRMGEPQYGRWARQIQSSNRTLGD